MTNWKLFCTFYFGLVCYGLSAQIVLKGNIIDQQTKEPIAYANIIFEKQSTGTFSDEAGAFSILIQNYNKTDIINISHVGYQSVRITLEDALNKSYFELNILELDKVLITAKSDFNIDKFIKEVVKNYNSNKKKDPHIATAYYSENAKKADDYIMLIESFGYSVFSGKMANAAVYSNYKFFADNSRVYLKHPEWQKFNGPQNKPVRPSASLNLRALRVLEQEGILSKAKIKDYEFSQDSTFYDSSEQLIRRISFKGRGDQGYLDVMSNSLHIVKICYATNDYFSAIENTEVNGDVELHFTYYEDTPYLKAVNSIYQLEDIKHEIEVQILTQKFKDFTFSKEAYWALNTYDSNPYLVYEPEIWEQFSDLRKNYQSVFNNLQLQGIDLNAEVMSYSNCWFSGSNSLSDRGQSIIASFKKYF